MEIREGDTGEVFEEDGEVGGVIAYLWMQNDLFSIDRSCIKELVFQLEGMKDNNENKECK